MRHLLIAALVLITSAAPALSAGGATGYWRTIDDSSGEARSIVHIEDHDGELRGRIVRLINPPEPDPVCDRCSGELHNAPVEGLEILWGFEESRPGQEWTGGQLLDPENGRIYRGRLRSQNDGSRLEVRGFIGSPLLGRSQLWQRDDGP